MLTLPIKKKWFDMILSGEKKEEYRELKPYYKTRFEHLWQGSLIGYDAKRQILFRNGYSRKSPSFIATVTLDIGEGRTEWGAKKGEHYYILKIHSIDELPWWIGKRCNNCGNEKCRSLGKLPKGHDCALWQPKDKEYKAEVITLGNCMICGNNRKRGRIMKVIIDGEIYISVTKAKERLHKNLLEEMKYTDSEEEKHGIEIADANVIVVLERMKTESEEQK